MKLPDGDSDEFIPLPGDVIPVNPMSSGMERRMGRSTAEVFDDHLRRAD